MPLPLALHYTPRFAITALRLRPARAGTPALRFARATALRCASLWLPGTSCKASQRLKYCSNSTSRSFSRIPFIQRRAVMASCSRGPDESVFYLYRGCGGAGPVAGGPRGVLFNDIAPRCTIVHPVPDRTRGKGLKRKADNLEGHKERCKGIIRYSTISLYQTLHQRP